MKILLILFLSIPLFHLHAQLPKQVFGAGAVIISPGYAMKSTAASPGTGLGIELSRERIYQDKFSWTLSAGFYHIPGEFRDPSGTTQNGFQKNLILLPFLTGIRYSFYKHFYAGAEAGVQFGVGRYIGNTFILAPSVGYRFSFGKPRLDAGIRLMNALGMPSTPENSTIQKGGYGYWVFRAVYIF